MLTPKFDTNFFERYAKISLTELVDRQFDHLVNRDRPDLQDEVNSIGIEVTRAMHESKNVAHALINEIAGRQIMDVSDEDWIDMTTHGYGYGLDATLIGKVEYNYWALAMPMKRIIANKIRKVDEGFYGDFDFFGLYVFSKEDLNQNQVKQTIRYAMDLQKNKSRTFSTLYISQIQELFVCDLEKETSEKIEINKSQRRLFYKKAIRKEPNN